jgi:TatD DNase family protein
MWIDSHCHLTYPDFQLDVDDAIRRARSSGVVAFLSVCTKREDVPHLRRLCIQYPDIVYSVGIHPHEAQDYSRTEIEELLSESHVKCVAVGETGLDYHYDHSPREIQRASFELHMDKALGRPIIIHTRNADEDTLACIDLFPHARGVFHCFSGSHDLAKAALDRGFYLSFSGIITFKKAQDIRDAVKYTPLDRILIETDSPFLAPVPHRGKRNEPAYVGYVAEEIARIKEITTEDVSRHTTNNFHALFGHV